MFGRWRHWAIAGAVVTGLAMRVLANPGFSPRVLAPSGYLPAVGPVALRFRDPVLPLTNLSKLAPPPPKPEPTNEPPPVEVAVKTNTPPPVVVVTPPPDTNSPLPTSIPATPPSASDSMISPQMLLQYFNRSTNHLSSGVVAPVQFAPPNSPTPPSSTATYSTGPGN